MRTLLRLLLIAMLVTLAVPAHAATQPTCADWPDLECVIVPEVQTSLDGGLTGTLYLVSNESPVVLNGTQTLYAPNGGRTTSTDIFPVPVAFSRPIYLQQWAGYGAAGTMVITSSQVFSIQVIDPQLGNCQNTTDLRCMDIYLSPNATQYAVFNTEGKSFVFNHDVYRDDVLIAQEPHAIGAFERPIYQLPTPPVGLRGEASAGVYRVNVYVAGPKPRVYMPMITK